ncbi:hypothetical protein GOV12_03920 [Candidatus Pacearchaeota archaeon]|nr:hypothetical protein [Candidatus Pacearchaeota archaeon]
MKKKFAKPLELILKSNIALGIVGMGPDILRVGKNDKGEMFIAPAPGKEDLHYIYCAQTPVENKVREIRTSWECDRISFSDDYVCLYHNGKCPELFMRRVKYSSYDKAEVFKLAEHLGITLPNPPSPL